MSDSLLIGRVKLRPSSKIYCAESAPQRLIVNTERIMSMKGCFNELVKLPQWTVTPLSGAESSGFGWFKDFVRRLGNQKGAFLYYDDDSSIE